MFLWTPDLQWREGSPSECLRLSVRHGICLAYFDKDDAKPTIVARDGEQIKICSCGRHHKEYDWLMLPFLGRHWEEGLDETVEYRNCPCGSTLARIEPNAIPERKVV